MTHWLMSYTHRDSTIYGLLQRGWPCVFIEADANPLGFGFCDG